MQYNKEILYPVFFSATYSTAPRIILTKERLRKNPFNVHFVSANWSRDAHVTIT